MVGLKLVYNNIEVLFGEYTSGLFTLTVEALCGCDKSRVCYIGEEDPLA